MSNIIRDILVAREVAAVAPRIAMAGKLYRPSSGTEGGAFDAAWCARCARDAAYRDAGADADPAIACRIIADALAYRESDPRYPREWVYGRDGRPCCTAFTEKACRPFRCDATLDMFGTLLSTKSDNK